jgi:hypothetical protein
MNYFILAESLSSLLGSKIGRMGDILTNTASTQIDYYQQRFSTVSEFYDLLFKDLMADKCNKKTAYETARKFFGKDTANFVAIDGTEYSKLMFDMIIFYAGAYSCEGTIDFTSSPDENNPQVKFQHRFLDRGKDTSSCVPIYVNKIPEIDQTFFDLSKGQVNIYYSFFVKIKMWKHKQKYSIF